MVEGILQPDNAFWRFSLAVYAAPGVMPACLELQDRFGLDVNLLLFCCWAGAARGVALSEPDIAEATAAAQEWRESVVAPLRTLRRRMKTMAAMHDPAAATLRNRIAALELDAEQIQQAMLFRLAGGWSEAMPGQGLALRNLRMLLAWSGTADGTIPAITRLAEAAEAQAHTAT